MARRKPKKTRRRSLGEPYTAPTGPMRWRPRTVEERTARAARDARDAIRYANGNRCRAAFGRLVMAHQEISRTFMDTNYQPEIYGKLMNDRYGQVIDATEVFKDRCLPFDSESDRDPPDLEHVPK